MLVGEFFVFRLGFGRWRTKIRVSCLPTFYLPRSLPSRRGLWCTANVQEALLATLVLRVPSRAGLKAWALRSATLVGENRPGWVRKHDLHRTLLIPRFEQFEARARDEPLPRP